MATGEEIITGELMATGKAELHSVPTTCDGRIVASCNLHFAGWLSSQLEFNLVLILVAAELYRQQVAWSIMDVDVSLYRCTSLLSTQYVVTQRYKRIRLTTRVYGSVHVHYRWKHGYLSKFNMKEYNVTQCEVALQ